MHQGAVGAVDAANENNREGGGGAATTAATIAATPDGKTKQTVQERNALRLAQQLKAKKVY